MVLVIHYGEKYYKFIKYYYIKIYEFLKLYTSCKKICIRNVNIRRENRDLICFSIYNFNLFLCLDNLTMKANKIRMTLM